MEKKIAIVGHGAIGKVCAERLKEKGAEVILVDLSEPNTESFIHHEPELILITHDPNVFYVNGTAYEPIPRKARKGVGGMGKMASIMAMAGMFADMSSMGYGSGYTRKLSPDIDIIQEFALIQHKKSKLSRWERDAVVRKFNSEYRIVKQ